jgi:putative ABC transport system ATP-binding protein
LAGEPTANLDAQVGVQVLKRFRDLAKSEVRALLIVTNDLRVRKVADRFVPIEDGAIFN